MDHMNDSAVNFTASAATTNYYSEITNRLTVIAGSLSFLLGLPTNSYIIWLIITGTGSGVASEIFNLNLSVCEICVCLNSLNIVLSVWFSSVHIMRLCQLALGTTGRSLFQCLICVERYLAVVHPVTFLKYKPIRYKVICCTVAWINTIGSCLFFMFILVLHRDKTQTVVWFFLLQFILILFIQLLCCLAVLRALKQSGPGEKVREREEENHMKRRAFQVILITTVNTVIVNIPNVILGLIAVLRQQYNAFMLIGLSYLILAGFVHPVYYLHRTRNLSWKSGNLSS